MYYGRNKQPLDGQLCLCRCPGWCDEGYQVAVFEDGEFHYSGESNNWLNEYVIAWMPIDREGELISNYLEIIK